LAGGVGGDLSTVAAEASEQRHAVDDLAAPLGEVVDGPLGDAGEVGDAVARRLPGDAEAAGELGPQVDLVEEPDGPAPRVEVAAVEGAPPIVAAGVGEVGDHDVGVQVRVARPGGAVPEGGRGERV